MLATILEPDYVRKHRKAGKRREQQFILEDSMEISDPIRQLLQRAKAAGLEIESRESSYSDEAYTYNFIFLPEGKEKRRLLIASRRKAEELQSIDFERYIFLSDYDAIADLKSGEIEAAVSSRDPMGTSMIERRLGFSPVPPGDSEFEGGEIEQQALTAGRPDGVRLEISKGTEELRVLSSNPSGRAASSLKIFLGGERSYEAALSALETLSNSLFFQLDLERGIALSLRKSPRRRRLSQRRRSETPHTENIKFPEFEYDNAPIALYWYAKSARSMPLLQFLAYYQVAEYYFPNFAKLEAIRTVRKILKNPAFRLDKESDLTKLISAISGTGRVGSSEREQMKATVREVLTEDDVLGYFADNEEVAEAVGKKNKLITEKTVNVARKDHDHRPDIAEMLYDIRCRIVHTKNDLGDARSEMLLPFSTAEEQLWPYIDLMQFVAQNALIRSSSSLRTL